MVLKLAIVKNIYEPKYVGKVQGSDMACVHVEHQAFESSHLSNYLKNREKDFHTISVVI